MFIACIAGYTWLYFVLSNERSESKQVQVCLIKQFTNIPCPSCGSTRSIILLTKGNFLQALNMNPMGVIIAFIMLLSPIWIIADLITRKKTFFDFYLKIESYLKRPRYAIPLILLVIINWIWNIAKGL
ncbi:DUF2752 domain-containing protein [Albibacterium bauzanense]|nr:DUF2752 domain-containing protein [Albibacterium bauzanense]